VTTCDANQPVLCHGGHLLTAVARTAVVCSTSPECRVSGGIVKLSENRCAAAWTHTSNRRSRISYLVIDLHAWELASRLRAYLAMLSERVQAMTDDGERAAAIEWLEWCETYAAEQDPATNAITMPTVRAPVYGELARSENSWDSARSARQRLCLTLRTVAYGTGGLSVAPADGSAPLARRPDARLASPIRQFLGTAS